MFMAVMRSIYDTLIICVSKKNARPKFIKSSEKFCKQQVLCWKVEKAFQILTGARFSEVLGYHLRKPLVLQIS